MLQCTIVPMADLRAILEETLGESGTSMLSADPVKAVMGRLAGPPARFSEALPLAEAIAAGPGPEPRRANAVRLLPALYLRTAPEPTPVADLFSPAYVPGTAERAEAARAGHFARLRDLLARLAADPDPEVARAAAVAALTGAERADLQALREKLLPLAGALEEAAGDRDVAAALLKLRGGAQAARWLADLAAGGDAPLDALDLAAAVADDPVPEALPPLERLYLADATVRKGHPPGPSIWQRIAGVAIGDPDVSHARLLLSAIGAVDFARAHMLAAEAALSLRPALEKQLVDDAVRHLLLDGRRPAPDDLAWLDARLDPEDHDQALAIARLDGARAVAWLADLVADRPAPLPAAELADEIARAPRPDAAAPLEALLDAAERRAASARAFLDLEGVTVRKLFAALAAVDRARADAFAARAPTLRPLLEGGR
jgi:hypothetical protein